MQRISKDGTKKFLPGSNVRGGFLKKGSGRETYVVEGYATALSVQLALKELYRDAQVLIAFSASNMPNVAWKKSRIVADHDLHKCGNRACGYKWDDPDLAGEHCLCPACLVKTHAVAAGAHYAWKTGCLWTMPPEPGDANDLHLTEGLPALVELMRELTGRRP